MPAYEPCGDGPHLYVRVRRQGETTQSLRSRLARYFDVRPEGVGYAGLKDKHALTSQTFSILLERPDQQTTPPTPDSFDLDGVELLDPPQRHNNKLKPGHLRGNRFSITVRDLDDGPQAAGARAQAIVDALSPTGWPNYFGPQRQGRDGDNAAQGLALLRSAGGRGGGRSRLKPWLRKLLLSAWQSELFDTWLEERIRSDAFDTLRPGDVAKKTDTGGMFDVSADPASADFAAELPRLREHAITFTGPMFGFKMRAPVSDSAAAEVEAGILAAAELPDDALKSARLPGARRPARLHPADFAVTPAADGDEAALTLTFELPKGAYATTVLREIMK